MGSRSPSIADKHPTYESSAEPTAGTEPQSQFGRARGELEVELLPAHSPQAKGRVERLFKTFQERLVNELRLARVATLAAANRFLEEYLPHYNQRFMMPSAQQTDLYRPCPACRELTRILCIKTNRVLRRDWDRDPQRAPLSGPHQRAGDAIRVTRS